MKLAADCLFPWHLQNLSLRPFKGFWSFNPSIHRDPDGVWRCVLRNADYHAPDGVVAANMKRGGRVQTRNAIVVLDPRTWQPLELHEMLERDGLPRNLAASSLGYEDLRLFRTERDGLAAIATTMQLRTDQRQEIVLLRLEHDYTIAEARPIRGPWSEVAQKNWMPFDGTLAPRLLYSIDRGIVFDERGPVGAHALPVAPAPRDASPSAARDTSGGLRFNGGIETRHTPRVVRVERADGAPRPLPPRAPGWTSPGLRGGSQLIEVEPDRWLGIGHEMRWAGGRKHYWHVWVLVDALGRTLERSAPMKLSQCGIEFAAGLALDEDGDRLVVSFGTEDQDSWLAITRLGAVLELLVPVERTEQVA